MDKTEITQTIKNHIPFTSMLYELVKSLLDAQNIKYHLIESRTKEVESLCEKIERKSISDYKKNILDITGIRIILYYLDDLDKVEDLINKNFKVDKENSINKETLYESNEFGYLSRHYIIELNKERKNLTEWKRFSNFQAEIQVRTVLQHSWASISHELSYKKEYDVPKELSRKLFRLAGIFELADEQFLEIRKKHKKLKSDITKLDEKGLSNESINVLTLEQELSKVDSIYDEIVNIAENNGFEKTKNLPANADRYLSGIKLVSNYLELKTIGEIEELLKANKDIYTKLFKKMTKEKDNTWFGPKSFLVLLSMLYNLNKVQLDKFSLEWNWKNSLWERTNYAILETKKQ